MAVGGATVQLATEEGTEGRAMALWMMVSAGLIPFGSLLIGVLAEVVHIRGALGIAGGGCALAGVASGLHTLRAWWRARRLARRESLGSVYTS